MDEVMDRVAKIELFFEHNPDIRAWCCDNLSNWDDARVLVSATTWGRYHVDYTFEVPNISEAEAVAARLRFS
jgi:hypothetical protein